MKTQNEKCPDTGKVEGATQENELAKYTAPYPRLSMVEKILVCFCTSYGVLLILWLAAIRLGVIHA